MKKLLLLLLAGTALLTACDQHEKEEKKVSKRNTAITKDNAFNDLFMDSIALVNYAVENELPDSLTRRMTSFYNARNYQYAWFSSNGISEQGMGFSSLLNFTGDTSDALKKLHQSVNELIAAGEIKITPANKKVLKTELDLTQNLIGYSKSNFKKGYVKRREIEQFIPSVKQDVLKLADSLLLHNAKEKGGFAEIHEPFRLLGVQLQKYVDLERQNSWQIINGDLKSFKKRGSSAAVAAVKRNLYLLGDLPSPDSSDLYDQNLEEGIKNFQKRHGYTADGKMSKPLIDLMNVPPKERIRQLLINMNRMRWIPHQPEGKLIMVNSPDFTLRVLENGKEVFNMPVVVGKEGHNTTIFSDMLTTIVFSPYWNIPESIVKSEILPAIEENPDYLEEHNMEVDGELNGLPKIRQKPGPENSLGKVKFLFPNSFNIYFHDTPAKSLFDRDVRTFSHGCIRLAEPEKLAEYLLHKNKEWDRKKILAAMDAGEEKFVKLSDPVPVFITYYTAWVDDNGILQLRNDIYGHDAQVSAKMFLD